METTNCGKCGRPLKDPKSIERGFGPTCWAKVQADQEHDHSVEQKEAKEEKK